MPRGKSGSSRIFSNAGNSGRYLSSDVSVDIAPVPELPEQAAALELLQSGFRYAFSLSHHQHDAEDLVQEAWRKLCLRYGGATSRAALFMTIRNLFIDRCRRAKILSFDSCDEEPLNLAAPDNASPCVLADLDGLLAGLRPGEREAIYPHYVEGHTAEEVGVLTRQPRGTVLSLLHRALHKLKIAAASSSSPGKASSPERNQ